ncbi:nucleoside diphosphate kinase [Phlyctochytrium arcticum]|nr:nucleoside diphosphate kinase [Phlyctochytrium arcticum]
MPTILRTRTGNLRLLLGFLLLIGSCWTINNQESECRPRRKDLESQFLRVFAPACSLTDWPSFGDNSAEAPTCSATIMSAHAKKVEIQGPQVATTNEEWQHTLSRPGLIVVDAYAKWAGQCEPMQTIFKRLKLDYGEKVAFTMAQTDFVDDLATFRDKSCPTFLFYFDGVLVKVVKGANVPMVERTIKEQLDLERTGQPHIPLVLGEVPAGAARSAYPQADVDIHAPSAPRVPHSTVDTSLESPTSSVPSEKTLAIIKPEAMAPGTVKELLDIIKRNRFEIVDRKKCWLVPAQVEELYREHEKQPYFEGVVTHLTSAPVLALVLSKDDAVSQWHKVMGPGNSARARDEAPSSIRGRLGIDNRLNVVYGSQTVESAAKDIETLFGPNSSVLDMHLTERDIVPQSSTTEKTLAIVKPDMIDSEKVEDIVQRIVSRGYQVMKRETVQLSAEEAGELYSHQKERPFYNDAVSFMSSGPIVALVLKGDDVIRGWREMLGPTDPQKARLEYPMSIRAIFGTDTVRNAAHGSDSPENASREIGQLFPSILMRAESSVFGARPGISGGSSRPDLAAQAGNYNSLLERTCAVIKPDAYGAGNKDKIIARIEQDKFKIIAHKEIRMTPEMAGAFYKEHTGKPFFDELVSWMTSGPVYALCLERDTAITAWRQLAGPTHSVKAKEIAPHSIRALYGTDGSQNAVHGSDSPEAAERELRILFGGSVSASPEQPAQSEAPSKTAQNEKLKPSAPFLERTLALIKPDAYGAGKKDDIVRRIQQEGFTIVHEAEETWTQEKASEFYKEHNGKPFFPDLVQRMSR